MEKEYATAEQRLYAGILDIGMKIGLVILVVTFGLYMTGVLEPHVPVDQLLTNLTNALVSTALVFALVIWKVRQVDR